MRKIISITFSLLIILTSYALFSTPSLASMPCGNSFSSNSLEKIGPVQVKSSSNTYSTCDSLGASCYQDTSPLSFQCYKAIAGSSNYYIRSTPSCSGISHKLQVQWGLGNTVNGCQLTVEAGTAAETRYHTVNCTGSMEIGSLFKCSVYRVCITDGSNKRCQDRAETVNCEIGGAPDSCRPSPPPYVPQSASIEEVFGRINPPAQISQLVGLGGAKGISTFLVNLIKLIFTLSAIIFIFMILISGVQWILSGGSKDAVASAQKRVTWAVIGITFLAVSLLLVNIVGKVLGFDFLS